MLLNVNESIIQPQYAPRFLTEKCANCIFFFKKYSVDNV